MRTRDARESHGARRRQPGGADVGANGRRPLPAPEPTRERLAWLTCALGGAAACALALPAVWWSPLNIDEELTVAVSRRSPGRIVDLVFGRRGGGPLHFLLEHATLWWPGGLVGLRVPSLVFFVAALPAVVLLARELAGKREGHVAVVTLAVAPLAVSYATFARPHMLFLAAFSWSVLLALRAARLGGTRRWAGAGLALGALVYVHPTAPLYAGIALVAAAVYAPRAPRSVAREAGTALAAFALAGVPFYVHAVGRLRDRYGVGGEHPHGRTYSGQSVPAAALDALAPTGRYLFAALAALGAVALARSRPRSAAVTGLLIVGPVAFFTVVPASSPSAIFFDRYMLPALPFFLVLVAAGCLMLAERAGSAGLAIAVALAVVLVALDVRADVRRLGQVHSIGVERLASAAANGDGRVLFGSTGAYAPRGTLDALTRARPPTLLWRYVWLRDQHFRYAADMTCRGARKFLDRGGRATGIWLFYSPGELPARPFAGVRGVGVERVGSSYLLVRSRLESARALVRLGIRLRRAWLRAVPGDLGSERLIRADRNALGARCAR